MEAEKQRERTLAHPLTPTKSNTVGILPGDGIGPRLIKQAVRVIKQLMAPELAAGQLKLEKINGCTIEERERTGEAIPAAVLHQIEQYPVLLKGPMVTPRGVSKSGKNVESANAKLRRTLNLAASMRPMKTSSGHQWTFFRENIEGPYLFGSKGIQVDDELAIDLVALTRSQALRLARLAFDYADKHHQSKVTVVTKASIVKLTDGNLIKACQEVAKEYPGIDLTSEYVDAMAANLLDPDFGKNIQVVVAQNLYGDIITDVAAKLTGGLGSAGSANIGENYAVFEAIHGTAPWLFAHHLEDYADPRSLLKAVVMMLNHLGYEKQSQRLDETIEKLPEESLPSKEHGITTADYVDQLLQRLKWNGVLVWN